MSFDDFSIHKIEIYNENKILYNFPLVSRIFQIQHEGRCNSVVDEASVTLEAPAEGVTLAESTTEFTVPSAVS